MTYKEKGDRYYQRLFEFIDKGLCKEDLLYMQTGAECYLKHIILTLSGYANLETLYKVHEIPHNLKYLYNDIFTKVPQENNPLYHDFTLKRRLNSLFGDYNASRFEDDPSFNLILNQEDLEYDFDTMTEAKKLVTDFERLYNYQKMNLQGDERN